MEIVDNGIMLVIPGAMTAGLASPLFWGSLALSLASLLSLVPVNRWLIGRQRPCSGPCASFTLLVRWDGTQASRVFQSPKKASSRRVQGRPMVGASPTANRETRKLVV